MKIITGNTIMGASGALHSPGVVPDTGSTAGTARFLREDATWVQAVQSVGLSLPSILTVVGSPVTDSGVLAVSLAPQAANTFLAGPASGTGTIPSFRALVAADVPATLGPTTFSGAVGASEVDLSSAQGVVLPDTANGHTYRLQVTNGAVVLTLVS